MSATLLCNIMVAVFFQGEIQIAELEFEGSLVRETQTEYVGNFSEDVKRLPLVGDAKNYSAVVVSKKKCLIWWKN